MRLSASPSTLLVSLGLANVVGCSAPESDDHEGAADYPAHCEEQTSAPAGTEPEWPEWEPPFPNDTGDMRLDLGAPEDVLDDHETNSSGADRDGLEDSTATESGVPWVESDAWQLDPETDTLFRGVTPAEAEENGWRADDLLIAMPAATQAMTQGAREVLVSLPLPGDDAGGIVPAQITLEHKRSFLGARFAQRRVGRDGTGTADAFQPLFHAYAQRGVRSGGHRIGPDDVFVDALADDFGGVRIEIATAAATHVITGPMLHPFVEHPPSAQTPAVFLLRTSWEHRALYGQPHAFSASPARSPHALELIGQCSDAIDNDDDGAWDQCDFDCVPHPDYGGDDVNAAWTYERGKSFGIFGDARFCTEHAGSWWTQMQDAGDKAALLLNQIDPPNTELDAPPIRFVMGGCAVMVDADGEDVSAACHVAGDCLPGFEDYPLAGFGEEPDAGDSFGAHPGGYIGRAWNMVDWMVDAMLLGRLEPVPLHMAIVWGEQIEPEIAGRAFTQWDKLWMWNRGAAVARPSVGHVPLAHEIGHLLGLPHDDGEYEGNPGIMRFPAGGYAPFLGNAVDELARDNDLTPYENWVTHPNDELFPRASGFGFTGCESDADCGHYPGLICVGESGGFARYCAPSSG